MYDIKVDIAKISKPLKKGYPATKMGILVNGKGKHKGLQGTEASI